MAGGATLKQLAGTLDPLREECICKAMNCEYCLLRGEKDKGCERCFFPVLEAAGCLSCHDK